MAFVVPILVPIGTASAESTHGENTHADLFTLPEDPVGPVANVFDIKETESYNHFPEDTTRMLMLEPGEPAITSELGQAFDEINMAWFGYTDSIRDDYAEFLEDVRFTVLGKPYGNVLNVGIHPSETSRFYEIKTKFNEMYPNVEFNLFISEGIIDAATITKISNVNAAIPNG